MLAIHKPEPAAVKPVISGPPKPALFAPPMVGGAWVVSLPLLGAATMFDETKAAEIAGRAVLAFFAANPDAAVRLSFACRSDSAVQAVLAACKHDERVTAAAVSGTLPTASATFAVVEASWRLRPVALIAVGGAGPATAIESEAKKHHTSGRVSGAYSFPVPQELTSTFPCPYIVRITLYVSVNNPN